jgi:peroxiredoxin
MIEKHIVEALQAAFLKARDLDAPVNQRCRVYADALREHHPVFAVAVDRLVERLERVGAGGSAPQVGEAMPTFLLPDDQGRLVSLGDILAQGPAAIAFHRGHWCPYCQINARALGTAHARAQAAGGQIVAITPERQHFTKLHKSLTGAAFPMLSDIANGYAQGTPSWFLPIPATFVVAADGIIRARFVDPDYRRRMDVDDLIAALAVAR